jgi:hypothetical protein
LVCTKDDDDCDDCPLPLPPFDGVGFRASNGAETWVLFATQGFVVGIPFGTKEIDWLLVNVAILEETGARSFDANLLPTTQTMNE